MAAKEAETLPGKQRPASMVRWVWVDVKLALGLGAILGPGQAILSIGSRTFLGAVVGGGLALLRGRSLRYGLPLFPSWQLGP